MLAVCLVMFVEGLSCVTQVKYLFVCLFVCFNLHFASILSPAPHTVRAVLKPLWYTCVLSTCGIRISLILACIASVFGFCFVCFLAARRTASYKG